MFFCVIFASVLAGLKFDQRLTSNCNNQKFAFRDDSYCNLDKKKQQLQYKKKKINKKNSDSM